MIVIYKDVTDKEIRKDAKTSIPKVEAWFEANPKRKSCNTQVWYGEMITIRRGHVEEDVMGAMRKALASNKEKREKRRNGER